MTGDDGLALAFSLGALRRLAEPAAVVADARTWATSVGVVTDRPPHALTTFTREHGIQQDFAPATETAAETLAHLLEHVETDRCLYVGTADTTDVPDGWEFLPVAEAAEAAGWELGEEPDEPGDTRLDTSTDEWP